ncbi:MAG: MATE family efflux transporter [Pirellulales bacterium]
MSNPYESPSTETASHERTASRSATVFQKKPLAELLTLAVPTVLQMVSYTVEQFTDVFMLSKLGNVEAAACVNAGMVVFCVISFGFGILMLINTLVSQSFGAGDHRACGRWLWQGVWMAVGYSAAMMPIMFWSRELFQAMGHADNVVPMEVEYFNVSIVFLVVKMLAVTFGQFMLAINRPNVVFISAIAGMLSNALINWLLIYGNWGAPAMGVAGSAWGTNSSIFIELSILVGVALAPRIRDQFHTLAVRFEWTKFRELLRIGLPSGFQTTGDVVAWTIFLAVVMPGFGEAAMAANGYMLQYMKMSFMPAFGLSTAVTALVARYVGAKNPEVAEHRAHLGFWVAMVYMIGCGVAFLLLRNRLMDLFTADPETIAIGGKLMIVCAAFQIFDAMFIIYIGALRGVRDTFVPSCVQIALCWSLVVGGGLAVAKLFPEWGVFGPWSLGIVYGVVLGTYLMARFRSGRWRTLEPETVAEAQRFDLAAATAVEPLGKS